MAAIVVGEMRELRLEREPDELLGAIVLVDPRVPVGGREGKGDRLANCRLRRERFRPQDRAALASVAEHYRRTRADDADAVFLDKFLRHEFIENLHDAVGEEVIARRTEIVL